MFRFILTLVLFTGTIASARSVLAPAHELGAFAEAPVSHAPALLVPDCDRINRLNLPLPHDAVWYLSHPFEAMVVNDGGKSLLKLRLLFGLGRCEEQGPLRLSRTRLGFLPMDAWQFDPAGKGPRSFVPLIEARAYPVTVHHPYAGLSVSHNVTEVTLDRELLLDELERGPVRLGIKFYLTGLYFGVRYLGSTIVDARFHFELRQDGGIWVRPVLR